MKEPPSFNEHERPHLRTPTPYAPKKPIPMPLGVWVYCAVLLLVTAGYVIWSWRHGTFWTGFRPGSIFVIWAVIYAIIICYHTIGERIGRR